MSVLITLASLTAMFTFSAFVCGSFHVEGYGFWRNIKETFVPNWTQFLFPACPFCWLARGTALAAVAFLIMQMAGKVTV